MFKHPLTGKASRQILKSCPFPNFIMELREEGVTAEIKKGSKENGRQVESRTVCRGCRRGLRRGVSKARPKAPSDVGGTGASGEADRGTGRADESCIREDRLLRVSVEYQRDWSCDIGCVSGRIRKPDKV